MKDVTIKIIKKHDEILDIIKKKVDTLVNFDWHSDYPLYSDDVIDADFFVKQIDPVYYEQNWAIVLASKGLMKNYYWIFPHNYAEDGTKILRSKNGDCHVLNSKFWKMEIYSNLISIDMDFFGNKMPLNWSPGNGSEKDRMQLLKDVLGTLRAENIELIISKSESYVNYDVEKFLQDMIVEISCNANIVDIS